MSEIQLTKMIFIRHGVTDWNVAQKWQGLADIPMNETGQQQASALAKRLANWPLEVIVSSDLQRCAQTAVTLARFHDLTPIYDPLWRERDVGDLSGYTSAEAREKYPHVWANGKRGMIDPPNGEPYLAVKRRALAAYQKTLAAHSGKMIAVVSHGGILHTLIAQLIGVDSGHYGGFSMRGNTGLSLVEINGDRPVLITLNDTGHLENGS